MHRLQTAPTIDRVEVGFTCPCGHEFTKVFAADVKAPTQWDCSRCGKNASTQSSSYSNSPAEPARTHWDMVQERRSQAELMVMLSQQVKQLRNR